MSEINIKIKQTASNSTYEIKIDKDAYVSELKDKIQQLTEITPELQNLVYKGRILNNTQKLSEYKLDNDHVIILVKKHVEEKKEEKKEDKTQESSGNTNSSVPVNNPDPFSMYGNLGFGAGAGMPGGLGGNMDMNQINQLMSNPMYQQAMDQVLSNPQMVQRMLDNPQIKPLLDQNPHLRQMMSNPDFLRTMMNPQTLQGLSSMMGQGQGQNQGFGFPQQPQSGQQQTGQQPNPFLLHGAPMSQFGGDFSNLYQGFNTNTNPREAYKEQNERLKEMGFTNDEANFDALSKTGGNVDAAVERLLNMLG